MASDASSTSWAAKWKVRGSTGESCPAAPTGRSSGADGVADLRARYTIEAAGGACILVSSDGLRHGPPEVIAQLARGEPVDPALYYFRTVMRFETGDADLAWLNRIIAIGRGIREPLAVRLDVHEVL
jgi:hypothetical protein